MKLFTQARWMGIMIVTASLLLSVGCSESEDESEPMISQAPVGDIQRDYSSVDCDTPENCAVLGDELVEQIREQFGDLLTDYISDEIGQTLEEQELVIYELDGDVLVNPQFIDVDDTYVAFRDDQDKHREVWEMFRQLIPEQARSLLSGLIIFTDGRDETLAYVEPDSNDNDQWLLAVDIMDADESMAMKATLLHEFAHLLTLQNKQMDMNEEVLVAEEDDPIHAIAEEACAYYFVSGMGCIKEASYLNQFYSQFWTDIADEWRERGVEDDEDELEKFYGDYEIRFVTEYAAASPEEDIAETWTYFILSPLTDGNEIWEQKILFFRQYPEQLQLRVDILNRLLTYLSR